jgi:hypothetical protein
LPTSATRRLLGGAADRVHERVVLRQQILADDRLERRAAGVCDALRSGVQGFRPHVVGRRVDEVARKPRRPDEARGLAHVRALRRRQARGGALALLVALECVGPEAPRNRRQGGCELARREGDAIVAGRQVLGQRPDRHRVDLVAHAEQHALDRAVRGWHEQDASVLRLEVVRRRQPLQRFGPSLDPLAPFAAAQHVDRNGESGGVAKEGEAGHWRVLRH